MNVGVLPRWMSKDWRVSTRWNAWLTMLMCQYNCFSKSDNSHYYFNTVYRWRGRTETPGLAQPAWWMPWRMSFVTSRAARIQWLGHLTDRWYYYETLILFWLHISKSISPLHCGVKMGKVFLSVQFGQVELLGDLKLPHKLRPLIASVSPTLNVSEHLENR